MHGYNEFPLIIIIIILIINTITLPSAICAGSILPFALMKCSYGERGSLTSTCYNASAAFFKYTPYKFDNLDETVRCMNCSLDTLTTGTFDISGNNIKTLDLTRSRISIIQTRAFVGLMFLENLLMPHNYIRSIYPGTFEGIKKIVYLDLQNNSISLLADNAFQELVNLRILNLKANYIASIKEKAFAGLGKLEQLYLDGNEISNVTGVFNSNLTSLKILNLENNRIQQITSEDFKYLKGLKELYLSNNSLNVVGEGIFRNLNNLEILIISGNPIESILPRSFEGLDKLETLDLESCKLREILRKTWQGLYNLKYLKLSYNRLLEFQTKMYSNLPELMRLNLSHNEIGTVERSGIFSLTVHTLDLSYNNITILEYDVFLEHFPKLSYLSLEHNPLQCNVRNGMRKYLESENMQFILHVDEKCDVIFNKTVITFVEKHNENAEQLKEDSSGGGTDYNNAVIYSFLVIIFLLIGALFFAQYKIYKELRYTQIRRFNSDARLVSCTNLQQTDGQYLGD